MNRSETRLLAALAAFLPALGAAAPLARVTPAVRPVTGAPALSLGASLGAPALAPALTGAPALTAPSLAPAPALAAPALAPAPAAADAAPARAALEAADAALSAPRADQGEVSRRAFDAAALSARPTRPACPPRTSRKA
jgi:hypothetical protein